MKIIQQDNYFPYIRLTSQIQHVFNYRPHDKALTTVMVNKRATDIGNNISVIHRIRNI